MPCCDCKDDVVLAEGLDSKRRVDAPSKRGITSSIWQSYADATKDPRNLKVHFQVAGILRGIGVTLPDGRSDSAFGWGVNTSLGVKTFGKDNVIFAVAAGHGISRYLQDTSGLGIDAEPAPSTIGNPHLEATPAIGV